MIRDDTQDRRTIGERRRDRLPRRWSFGRVTRVLLWSVALALALALLAGGLWFEHERGWDLGPEAAIVPPHAVPDPLLHDDGSVAAARPGALPFVGLEGEQRIADLPPAWRWVYFGYTACPDICPGSLAIIAMALREADADPELADALARVPPEALFVSVDAPRDAPAMVVEYAHYFHPRIRGGVLPEHATDQAREAFGLVFQRVDLAGSAVGYVVDHSSVIYLLDPDNRLVALHPHGDGPDALVSALRQAVASAASDADDGATLDDAATSRVR